MNQSTLLGKLLSPAGFGLVLLLFFLPFVAVSCGPDPHRVTATFSGLDMVTGAPPYFSGPDIQPDDQTDVSSLFADQYDNEPLALLAAAVVLGGMVTAFIRDRRIRHIAAVALAGLAAGLLQAAEIRSVGRLNHIQLYSADGQLTDISPVYARPLIGFYLAMGVLLALVVAHAIALFRAPPAGAASEAADGYGGGARAPDGTAHAGPAYGEEGYGPPDRDEQWARPPIWAADEEITVREESQPDAGEAYREWLEEAWPSTPGEPPPPTPQPRTPPAHEG